jgi:hypothetical protein
MFKVDHGTDTSGNAISQGAISNLTVYDKLDVSGNAVVTGDVSAANVVGTTGVTVNTVELLEGNNQLVIGPIADEHGISVPGLAYLNGGISIPTGKKLDGDVDAVLVKSMAVKTPTILSDTGDNMLRQYISSTIEVGDIQNSNRLSLVSSGDMRATIGSITVMDITEVESTSKRGRSSTLELRSVRPEL